MKKLLLAILIGCSLFAAFGTPTHAALSPNTAQTFNTLLDAFNISDVDEQVATPRYYGFLRLDGSWYIMKETNTAGLKVYTYVKGTASYSTNWTGRAGLTYADFQTVFVEPIN